MKRNTQYKPFIILCLLVICSKSLVIVCIQISPNLTDKVLLWKLINLLLIQIITKRVPTFNCLFAKSISARGWFPVLFAIIYKRNRISIVVHWQGKSIRYLDFSCWPSVSNTVCIRAVSSEECVVKRFDTVFGLEREKGTMVKHNWRRTSTDIG